VSCPTRYEAESSSINLRRSIKYGLGVLRTSGQYRLRKHGLRQYPYLDIDPASVHPRLQPADTTAEPAAQVRERAAQVGEPARTDG
jgi:hypothetical protein